MKELISFLEAQGFTKVDKIETLKVTLSNVERQDENTDIPSRDKRHYWDGKAFGLHISGTETELKNDEWDTLLALLTKNKANVKVLYLGNTLREELSLTSFPALQFLNLFANHHIKIVTLKDCPNLESLTTYGCDVLQTIELRGSFLKLEKLDVSYCPSLSELVFPTHFPNFRFFHAIKTKLENDYVALGSFFGEELRGRTSAVRRQNSITTLLKPLEQEIGVSLSECVNFDEFGNIVFLDLGHLGLSKLPKSLLNIHTLGRLCLGSYYPIDLNKVGWKFANYHKVNPNLYNKFTSVELSKLHNLKNLEGLYLNSCSLDNLNFLERLETLTELDIAQNPQLTDYSIVEHLKNLKLFHASNPSINIDKLKLPKGIVSLTLENSKIKSLQFLNELTDLAIAILKGNEIETNELILFIYSNNKINVRNLDLITFNLTFNRGVHLQDNPIDEGFLRLFDETDNNKKKELIINYIKNYFKEDEEIKVKLIKLILIGNTRAGKTTLYDIINQNNPAKSGEDSTHGINIFQIDEGESEEQFIIKGYDFGGQDYYHSTHWAYFTTNNTLYSLVFRSDWEDIFYVHENDLTYPLNYWLDAIRKISKVESNASTTDDIHVQLIQNKYGEIIQDLNLKSIKEGGGRVEN